MELITRKWTDINRKVQQGGLWALVTIIVSMLMRQLDMEGDPQVIVTAIQELLMTLGPVIPVIAGYMSRETKSAP